MRALCYALLISAAVTAVPIASAQERQSPRIPKSDEIIVEGLLVPGEKPPTTVTPGTSVGLDNRKFYENSQRVAKCAMRTSLPHLRQAIDGAPNSGPQREAQAWLIRRTATCNADAAIMARQSNGFSQAAGLASNPSMAPLLQMTGLDVTHTSELDQSAQGVSVYDRGALLERVLDLYAPEITLTKEQTTDAEVQGRFNLRESPRNGYRLKADLDYFKAVVCMVRLQPKLAVSLYQAKPGSGRNMRIQSAMINNARVCVNNAKKVYVDSTQFRIYVMDALYRWVLAARNVESLLPLDSVAGAAAVDRSPS